MSRIVVHRGRCIINRSTSSLSVDDAKNMRIAQLNITTGEQGIYAVINSLQFRDIDLTKPL